MFAKAIATFYLIISKITYLSHCKKVMKGPEKNADHVEEIFF